MAFENLSERLQNTIAKLTGKGKVSEADVKEMMREVRLALLEADVNFKVVKEFVKKISERAVGTEVMKSLTPAQQIVKIVNEELVELKIHFPTIIQGKNFLIIATTNKIKFTKKWISKFARIVSAATLNVKNKIYLKADFTYPLLIITIKQSNVKIAHRKYIG